ncbi:MAG: permease-like cell division protein FtsX [Clostridia bacterium]|nr:permease-like cell division protein FtsX [Clostridia bacterium]
MSTRTYLIGQGYDNLRKHGGKTFSTMLIICATMVVLGLFIILFMNIESNVKSVTQTQGLQAFISDEIADSEIEELAASLSGISNVKDIKYIDKDAALEDAKDTLKDYAYLLEGMEDTNPFPRSFIITFANLENTQGVKEAIESVDGIYKVSYNEKIINGVIAISQIVNYAVIGLGVVMMVISIFIISNTIKLAVYSNKREIYIMKYLGATSKFIKYPFIVEGILMGLASAIISWIMVSLAYSTAYIYLPKVGAELGVFGFVGYSSMWHIILIAFLVLGIFLGGVGSSFATRKYLKEFRPIKVANTKRSKKNKQDKDDSSKEQAKREKTRQKEEIKLKKENLKREAKEKQEQEKKSKQEFERKRKARRLSIFLLVLVMSAPFTNILFAESTQDKIDAIDKETSAAAKKYEQVQADIKVYEADIAELDGEVEKYTEEVNNLSNKVEAAKADVEEIAAKLQNVSSHYEATEQLLNTRLRVLYENGFVNMWEVLLSAESITDFLAKYNVLATLIENDKKNLEEMNDQKKYIQSLKESADLKRLQIEQAEYDVQKSKEALESAMTTKTNRLNQLETSKAELKTMMANLKKEREKQEEILAKEIAAAQGNNIKFSGEFTWPTPGVYYITAMFMDKEYYYWSGSKHKGTDIAKSGGCNIVAAQTGKVIVASGNGAYNGGYGNYVIIDHGTKDGVRYTTVYAHLKSVSVKKGDTVVKGQKIGYMGSTGWSTGTHLHFEIRRNNVQINAMQYFPELKGIATYLSYSRWIAYPFGNEAKYQI